MKSIKLPSWIERLAGLNPRPVPPHVFFLTGERLAYACFPRSEQGSVLKEYRFTHLPAETFHAGAVGGLEKEEGALEEALSSLLAQVSSPIGEASLVLPDAWLRLAFTEIGELPADPHERDEVLRWKLKRLVPFRVDELRLASAEVSPFQDQEEDRRALLGFGLESLFQRLEDLFAAHGIHLGWIGSQSLSLLSALKPSVADSEGLLGLALVDAGGYTLLFSQSGEPVLHRFKAEDGGMPYEVRERHIARDLRLTRTFLDEKMPEHPLARVLLLQAPDLEEPWARWLEDGLQASVARLDENALIPLQVQLSEDQAAGATSWLEVAPLLGATRQEVA